MTPSRERPWVPTPEQLQAAKGRKLPDVIRPGLDLLIVGINPGLYTAAVGHHFARPGNRFWKALHAGGLTPRVVSPFDERDLLDLGIGITNVFDEASASADELSREQLLEGGEKLRRKLLEFRPRIVAFLGIGAYRAAFGQPKAPLGPQPERLEGALVWVLPNPSGLNAHYSLEKLGQLFGDLKKALQSLP